MSWLFGRKLGVVGGTALYRTLLAPLCVLATLATLVSTARPAQASFTVQNVGVVRTPFATSYEKSLLFIPSFPDEVLNPGASVTFFDVGAITPAVTTSPFLPLTQLFTGQTPSGLAPNDAPNILNATFTYTGPRVTTKTSLSCNFYVPPGVAFVDQGLCTAENTFSGGSTKVVDFTQLPRGFASNAAVPEPGTFALAAVRVFPLAGLIRRRNRRRN